MGVPDVRDDWLTLGSEKVVEQGGQGSRRVRGGLHRVYAAVQVEL